MFCPHRRSIEEVAALLVVSPFGEDDVNEFVDAGGLCAGSVGGRNDLVDHGNNGLVLVRIEGAEP